MSNIELDVSMDMDTGLLWEGEESETEETPAQQPVDDLQSLVPGEEDLFMDTQLVGMVDSPKSVDPCLPSLRTPEVSAILEPSHFLWCQDMEEKKRRLLES